MIEITLHGENVAELRKHAEQVFGGTFVAQSVVPLVATNAGQPETTKPASGRTRASAAEKKATETGQAISSGEERVDTADAEKQDAADEAADKKTTEKLNHDSVRTALGAYVKKFGLPAVQEDGPKVLEMIFGKGKTKVSEIPDTQEDLAKAVAGIDEMTAKNPFKRDVVK